MHLVALVCLICLFGIGAENVAKKSDPGMESKQYNSNMQPHHSPQFVSLNRGHEQVAAVKNQG